MKIRRPSKRTLAFLLIFLIGLSILLYPIISNMWNQILANRVMDDYEDSVSKMPSEDLKGILEDAYDYNNRLLPKKVPDAFTIRDSIKDLEYEELLNVTNDGMMGYIEIPVIKAKSPIFHYTTEDILQKGVGHLFGSSLPVGGKGTHAVLTAHRGLPSNKLFTDLDKVKKGDKFFITVVGKTLAYQVDQIKVVEPNQTESLALVDGKDYVTLVTCTPYGVNTHRILCRGHRVPYVPGEEDDIDSRTWLNMNLITGIIGALLGIIIAIILAIRLRKRNKELDASELTQNVTEPEDETTESGQEDTEQEQRTIESDE